MACWESSEVSFSYFAVVLVAINLTNGGQVFASRESILR